MHDQSQAMVFITYTPGPAARPDLYESWLQSEDNPTFNAVPGIGEYSNWKVVEPRTTKLPWSHFDFLGLSTPEQLEAVWFDPVLERFRAKWVALWGYGSTGPSLVNGHGHLCEHVGEPIRARARWVEIAFDEDGGAGVVQPGERWDVRGTVRKHYALGPAPAGESWFRPVEAFNPLGYKQLTLIFHDRRPASSSWSSDRVLAACIAAPSVRA